MSWTPLQTAASRRRKAPPAGSTAAYRTRIHYTLSVAAPPTLHCARDELPHCALTLYGGTVQNDFTVPFVRFRASISSWSLGPADSRQRFLKIIYYKAGRNSLDKIWARLNFRRLRYSLAYITHHCTHATQRAVSIHWQRGIAYEEQLQLMGV